MKKRLLSITLCLCMALTIMPTVALTANATSVWVNGVELTSATPYLASNNVTEAQATKPASGGYAYFNDGTLTLNEYQNSTTMAAHKIGTTVGPPETSSIWATIYADGDLNLVLSGASTVNTKDGIYNSEALDISVLAQKAACVYVTGALTVSGTGSAALSTGTSFYSDDAYNYGIYAGSLAVSSGTLTLKPATVKTIPTMDGLNYTVSSAKTVSNTAGGNAYAYGIYSAGNISITGGNITAKSASGFGSSEVSTNAYGIYAAGTLSVAAGATVAVGNYRNSMTYLAQSYGIYSGGEMTLSGAVTAETEVATETTGIECDATLTIAGSAMVSATTKGIPEDAAHNAYGIRGNSVTIGDSAQVTARAYGIDNSYGIYGTTVTLKDTAVITARADSVGDIMSVAICADKPLSIPTTATYNANKDGSSPANQILATDKTADVIIYCDPCIRITFDACNGSSNTVIVDDSFTALPAPSLTGYTFAGWYPAPNGENADGKAFTDADKLTVDDAKALKMSGTYYAKWTKGDAGKTVRTTPLMLDTQCATAIDKSETQGWKWDSETKTLTFNGANIVTTGQYALHIDSGLGSVKIVLADDSENTISVSGGTIAISAGLYAENTVTILGAGTLNATGGTANGTSAGIIAPLTVDGATVIATGSKTTAGYGISGDLTLTSGTVTATGGKYGMSCASATINGGTLNATGASTGIYCDSNNSTFAIEVGATVTAKATGGVAVSCGLQTVGANLVVNGTLTAAVTGGNGAHSYGADIGGTLSGSGSITATGNASTGKSVGLQLNNGSAFSGTLNATGGASSESYGILGINSSAEVKLPDTITALCDATANRHYQVCAAGTLANLLNQTFTGSVVSSAGMVVYSNDSYFDKTIQTPFSSLTIKDGQTLTIASTAQFYAASAESITLGEESKLVNNGWIYLTTGTGAKIAALDIAGDGYIRVGDTVYSNKGEAFEHVVVGDINLTDGNDASAVGMYTYADNQLTIDTGTVVLGDVKLPANKEITVVMENGASVQGDLSIVGIGAGELTITVNSGDSAAVGGIKVQQMENAANFPLNIIGGGTLASGNISMRIPEGYSSEETYDMSLTVEKNTTLNITDTADGTGAGLSIGVTSNTGGLTVKGTMVVHTPNALVSMILPRITIESGASLTAGCQLAADIRPSVNTGKALTVERGGTLIANGTVASIVIVAKTVESIDNLVSLPYGYLPSGVSFREFSSSYQVPEDTLYTLAKQDDVLMDNSSHSAFIPSGGEASVEIRSRTSGGGGGGSTSSYTLSFDTNGGSSIAMVSKTYGVTVDLSAYIPTRESYTFDGWCSDAALTDKVTSIKLTKNSTVYAKWTSNTVIPEMLFTDVPEDAYYKDAVIWAVGKGITEGTGATMFSPDGICTRAQAAAFLWRANGSPTPKATVMPFDDVPVDSYYYNAVLWTVEQGIIKGTSEKAFSPDMNCSRAHIVTMLWRMDGSKAATVSNLFTDVILTDYYADAVLWAVDEKITTGTSATTFSPANYCTRAQIVTFLYRNMK